MLIATYNLVAAKARLEAHLGDEVLWSDLAHALGISPSTISLLKNGSPLLRIDLAFVSRMIEHFRSRGVELTFYDLVTIEDVSEGEAIKGEPASEALTEAIAV